MQSALYMRFMHSLRCFSRTIRTSLFYSLTREGRPFYLRALWHISGRPVESRGIEIRFSRSPRALRGLIIPSLLLSATLTAVRASRSEDARSSSAVLSSRLLICSIFHHDEFHWLWSYSDTVIIFVMTRIF